VEANANAVGECRAKGLDVVEDDLVSFLRAQATGSLGGVFAAQVVEHLPPAALQQLLQESHRALRPGGLLLLETVNARSAFAFHEVFIRDLTHERPLHPETLRFLAAAAGFTEARIEPRSPVPEDVRLHPVPGGGMPPPVVKALNENVVRLNALLFAPVDYALLARR
jgi:O-antigen chain-terminating methyltransferase